MSRVGALGELASRRSLTMRFGEPGPAGPGSDCAVGEVGSGLAPMGDPCIPRRLEDARAGGAPPRSAAMFEVFACVARMVTSAVATFQLRPLLTGTVPKEELVKPKRQP